VLDVCLCFNDAGGDYYRHPMVTLTSVVLNTRSPVRAHLLTDASLTGEARRAFGDLAVRLGCEILLYDSPEVDDAVVAKVPQCFGRGSLYRLFMPDLIQAGPVLYLDCDIVCALDIAPLFAKGLGGALVAGVTDRGVTEDARSRRRLRREGLSPESYVNSGVLLMDLDGLRRDCADMAPFVLEKIASRPLRYPDQDAMNAYFQEIGAGVRLLPEKWNFVIGSKDRAFLPCAEYRGKMLHYTRGKPWKLRYPAGLLYWEYYARCFSAAEAFAGMEALAPHDHEDLFRWLLLRPGMRRMVGRLHDIEARGLANALLDRIFPKRRKAGRM
jgi:lipopolysaccharide biosynthesis glycosyltransferase